MNTASLENCKKLYELSGWDLTTAKTWINYRNVGNDTYFQMVTDEIYSEKDETHICPAYYLGFLLRKLPDIRLRMIGARWCAQNTEYGKDYLADTPEDAACLLVIKLFEEGAMK